MSNEPDDAIDDGGEAKPTVLRWSDNEFCIFIGIFLFIGIGTGMWMHSVWVDWRKSDRSVRVISRDCQGVPIVLPPPHDGKEILASRPVAVAYVATAHTTPLPLIVAYLDVTIGDWVEPSHMAHEAKLLADRLGCILSVKYRGAKFDVTSLDREGTIIDRWVGESEKAVGKK